MYVLDIVGTIILFIREMYGNKKFSWSGAFSVLTNYLFLFGLISILFQRARSLVYNLFAVWIYSSMLD